MDGRKIPMVYERFAAFSKWVHIATGFCMVLQNLFEMFKSVQECFRIDPFIGELPNESRFVNFLTIGCENFDNLVL